MNKKLGYILIMLCIFTIFVCSCSQVYSEKRMYKGVDGPHRMDAEKWTAAVLTALEKRNILEMKPADTQIAGFIEDSGMPDELWDKFKEAAGGSEKVLRWYNKHPDKSSFLFDLFKSSYISEYIENFYYDIGMLYYKGNKKQAFKADKEKAFQWYCLAAAQGHFPAAITAGDMARLGDGMSVNGNDAFALYQKALEIEKNSYVYERLAVCYQEGIGTDRDLQKAKEYIWLNMLEGEANGFYQYLSTVDLDQKERLLLSKAASSLYLSYDMNIDNFNGYSAGAWEKKVIQELEKVWDDGTDESAVKIKDNLRHNQYFPKDFAEAFARVSYTYSYDSFADTYGIAPNQGRGDGKISSLQREKCQTKFLMTII